MDVSLQSILYFIIITVVFFAFPSIGKPTLTLNDLVSIDEYSSKCKTRLLFYLGMVVTSQLLLNVGYLMSKCGGSLDQNIGSATLFTIVPWVFIFGVMMAVLFVFPGFKKAFSDVIGYFAISGKANDLLVSMLLDTTGTNANDTNDTNANGTNTTTNEVSDTIMKIYGNKSILINQITPDNFMQMWDTLKSLMKPGIYENVETKTQLLDLVVLKDNIGEAMWYIYTAIFISSIVYYNLATKGCVKSVAQMKKDRNDFLEKKEAVDKQTEINQSTPYVLS